MFPFNFGEGYLNIIIEDYLFLIRSPNIDFIWWFELFRINLSPLNICWCPNTEKSRQIYFTTLQVLNYLTQSHDICVSASLASEFETVADIKCNNEGFQKKVVPQGCFLSVISFRLVCQLLTSVFADFFRQNRLWSFDLAAKQLDNCISCQTQLPANYAEERDCAETKL